jgi:hypothetical protein
VPVHAVGAAPTPVTTTQVGNQGVAGVTIGLVYTLTVVLVGWVFFRARTLHDAIYILKSWTHFGPVSYGTFKLQGLPSVELLILIVHIGVLIVVDTLIVTQPRKLRRLYMSRFLLMFGALALFYDIFLFGVFGSIDFIYFQF